MHNVINFEELLGLKLIILVSRILSKVTTALVAIRKFRLRTAHNDSA